MARYNNAEERPDQDYVDAMEKILDNGIRPSHERDPDEILPHLYVGSILNAENYNLLRQLGITHVLNCAAYQGQRSYDGSPYEGVNIDYYEFPANDSESYDIAQHFQESFKFLNKAKRKGGCVLVHCAQGLNRSIAVTVAYLMWFNHMTLLSAVRHMQQKRGSVLSNRGFQKQLVKFAKRYGFLDKPKKLNEVIPKSQPERREPINSKKSKFETYEDYNYGKPPKSVNSFSTHEDYNYGKPPKSVNNFSTHEDYNYGKPPKSVNSFSNHKDDINRNSLFKCTENGFGNEKEIRNRYDWFKPNGIIIRRNSLANGFTYGAYHKELEKPSYTSRSEDMPCDFRDKTISTGSSVFEDYIKRMRQY